MNANHGKAAATVTTAATRTQATAALKSANHGETTATIITAATTTQALTEILPLTPTRADSMIVIAAMGASNRQAVKQVPPSFPLAATASAAPSQRVTNQNRRLEAVGTQRAGMDSLGRALLRVQLAGR